jgi:hypothetical protein
MEYVAPDGAGDFIGYITTTMSRLRRLSFYLWSFNDVWTSPVRGEIFVENIIKAIKAPLGATSSAIASQKLLLPLRGYCYAPKRLVTLQQSQAFRPRPVTSNISL